MTESLANLETRMGHAEADIIDLKCSDKDIYREMAIVKESHIETKIYLKQIQETQAKMERDSKASTEYMIQGLQDIKDRPIKDYDKIKIGIWLFVITYVMGNIFGLMKIFTPTS